LIRASPIDRFSFKPAGILTMLARGRIMRSIFRRIELSDDCVVKRLRLVMVGAMLFSAILTLLGQPQSFWQNPQTAMRGDGLSLYNTTNRTFDFFLGRGWLAYVAAFLVYLALAFVIVSILPRMTALVATFSFIFGHYFGACNWLATRWHLGFAGVGSYGLLLSAAIAWAVSPIPGATGDQMIKRVRWVMIGVMLIDPIVTLIGEAASYWLHPQTVHEGNGLWRWFMMRGWSAYVLADLVYCLGAFWLASNLPRFFAVLSIFAFTLGHFIGASNWSFYDWRLGMETPVLYGILLSGILVWTASAVTRRQEGKVNAEADRQCAGCFSTS
jgi:hypothetical protein